MPEQEELSKDENDKSKDRVKAKQWVFLQLPNDHSKLVHVKPKHASKKAKIGNNDERNVEDTFFNTDGSGEDCVDLGRYGKFPTWHLIGKHFHRVYTIEKNVLEATTHRSIEDLLDELDSEDDDDDGKVETEKNNELLSDTNTSQSLTDTQISAIKNTSSTAALIKALVLGSKTHASKTAFAQQKYLVRKLRKFGKWITILPITPGTLCKHFGSFREDAIAHGLYALNLHSGARIMVWDEWKHLWTASVVWRCPEVQCIPIYQGPMFQPGYLTYLDDEQVDRCVFPLAWDKPPPEDFIPKHPPAVDLSLAKSRHLERHRKHTIAAHGGPMDALLIAAKPDSHTLTSILRAFENRLALSGKLVLVSPTVDALTHLYARLRVSQEWIDVRLYEAWCLQEWQTHPGRMHPLMNGNGSGAFFLTAIRVKQ